MSQYVCEWREDSKGVLWLKWLVLALGVSPKPGVQFATDEAAYNALDAGRVLIKSRPMH